MNENIQTQLLYILQQTIEVLEKNNIWYSLACGSVLGTVREGGFIPWDTDIDIFVKISDVSLIHNLFSEEAKDITLVSYKKDTTSTHDKVSLKGANHSVIHIDLYPLIGTPDNEFMRKLFIKECHYLNKIFACKYEDVSTVRKKYKAFLFIVLQSFEKLIPDKWIRRAITSIENKYSFDESSYLTYFANDGNCTEAIDRNIILETVKAKFENIEVRIPLNSDFYLRQVYGDDYMIPKKY